MAWIQLFSCNRSFWDVFVPYIASYNDYLTLKSGAKIKLFYVYDSQVGTYNLCVAYRSNAQTNDLQTFLTPESISNFRWKCYWGQQQYVQDPFVMYAINRYGTNMRGRASTYKQYDSTVGAGFIVLQQGTKISGQSDSFYRDYPDSSVRNINFSVPTFTYSDNRDFWLNIASQSVGFFPFEEENTTSGGGAGKWDDNTTEEVDVINETSLNNNSIIKTFFVTTYALSSTQLETLAEEFWQPNMQTALKEMFSNNPMESIISLSLMPISYTSTNYDEVIIGSYHTNATANVVREQFRKVDCGTITISEKWGGFIDYQTRIMIYLPYIGYRVLDPQEVMNTTLHVYYIVDMLTGTCVAYIKATRQGGLDSVLYQFTGNCSYNLPLSQSNYTQYMQSLIKMTADVGVGVVTGSGMSAQSFVGDASSVLFSTRPNIAHGGTLSANAGFLSIKKPYIILERPHQALPAKMGNFKGYQCHITTLLSAVSGYTEVEYVHLEGITRATAEELAEIERLLKDGVII